MQFYISEALLKAHQGRDWIRLLINIPLFPSSMQALYWPSMGGWWALWLLRSIESWNYLQILNIFSSWEVCIFGSWGDCLIFYSFCHIFREFTTSWRRRVLSANKTFFIKTGWFRIKCSSGVYYWSYEWNRKSTYRVGLMT